MAGGVLIDVDFVLLPFSFFNEIHRVVTHNIFFLFALALLLGMWAEQPERRRVFFSVLLGGALHLFFDSILDSNPTNGIGVALFWPVSDGMFSPFNLVVDQVEVGWSDLAGSLYAVLKDMLYELPFAIAALFLAVYRIRCALRRILWRYL